MTGPTGEKREGVTEGAIARAKRVMNLPNADVATLLCNMAVRIERYEDSGKVLVDRETLRVAEVLLQAVGDEFTRMDEHNEASGWTWTVDGCTVSPHHIADEANSVAELLRAALTSSPGEESEAGA